MRIHLFIPFGLALLLVVGGAIVWINATAREDEPATNQALSARERGDANPAPLIAPDDDRAVRRVLETSADVTPSASPALSFVGRCVNTAGAPVEGVAFVLRSWVSQGEKEQPLQLPEVAARSDAEGRVHLLAEHREGIWATCLLLDPRFVRMNWHWNELAPGTRSELGEIVVQAGAVLRGRVLDRAGAPLLEHWTVELRPQDSSSPLGWSPRAEAAGSERFEISGLAAGEWRIAARYPSFELCTLELELAAGETREIELRQRTARDASREIVVRAHIDPLCPPPHPDHVRLVLPGGEKRPPRDATSHRIEEDHVFADLEPGAYRIEIDDPRYLPWSANDVRPGPQVVVARLQGSSALELSVTDGSTGAPVERYAFELVEHASEYRGSGRSSSGSSNLERARKASERVGGRARIAHLVAGRLRFVLQAESYPPLLVEVPSLEPGEARVLSVELFRGTSIEGEVRRAGSGAPVEGALVALFAPAEVDDNPSSPLLPKGMSTGNDRERRRELARTTTDAAGRFRLENLQPGTWILTATKAGERKDARRTWPMDRAATCAKIENLRIQGGQTDSGVVIELPAASSFVGRARVPEGASPVGLGLQLARKAVPGEDPVYARPSRGTTAWLDPTGEFRFEELAAGAYELRVLYPSIGIGKPEQARQRLLNGPAVLLEELLLAEGENARRDLDLASFLPARIEARLRFRGGSPGRFAVYIQTPPAPPGQSPERQFHQQAEGNEEGVALHVEVAPGPKVVFAMGVDRWVHVLATHLDATPGSSHLLEGDVEFHGGALEVLDVNGQPLTSARVSFHAVTDPPVADFFNHLELDAHARCELALPAGRYRIASTRRSEQEKLYSAEFDWPGGALITARLVEEAKSK
ncbi:MAG: carboxypeptidase regulatory-like domain-containing protein [Planctomycetes bacterium]|nr:carboxypeptidase regulatory-like domain-containing protein [Planctomycetota bacterium]